jgi:hypothetical protein
LTHRRSEAKAASFTRIGKKEQNVSPNGSVAAQNGKNQDLSKTLRRRIYSCGFCYLISHLPEGADSLNSDDRWFYLDHLKREHGLSP